MDEATTRQRWKRGLSSLLASLVHPLGRLFVRRIEPLRSPERMARGWVLVLPGIDGVSSLSVSLAEGLNDGGVECGIEIVDWTTGWPRYLKHLQNLKRNRAQARAIAERIVAYQQDHPGQPVHLIGHSAGAGMALLILEALPPDQKVASATLIGAAVSPDYDLRPALEKTVAGIRNFYSVLDLLFLGLGTLIFGTVDRRHCVAAGICNFRYRKTSEEDRALPPFLSQPFQWRMVRQFNLGGHFGFTNRVFAAESLAPYLRTAKPAD